MDLMLVSLLEIGFVTTRIACVKLKMDILLASACMIIAGFASVVELLLSVIISIFMFLVYCVIIQSFVILLENYIRFLCIFDL